MRMKTGIHCETASFVGADRRGLPIRAHEQRHGSEISHDRT